MRETMISAATAKLRTVHRLRSLRLRRVILAVIASVAPAGVVAQEVDSIRPAPTVMWRDVGVIAGGGALAAIFQRNDLAVRREVRSEGWQRGRVNQFVSDIGNPWGDPGTFLLGIGLWAGGRVSDRPVMAAVGFRTFEAIGVSGVITQVVKNAIGRARPRVSPDDAWDVEWWRGWSVPHGDYAAMPSGHSTAAFAFAAAATDELARRGHPRTALVGVTTYSLAAMASYARMHRDAHWLSDVTMGAAIGIASGLAVTRWHATRPGNRLDGFALGTGVAPHVAPHTAPHTAPRIAPLITTGADGATLIGASISWR